VVNETGEAIGLATPTRERILGRVVWSVTSLGITLPAAFVLAIGLADMSSYLARMDALDWLVEYATILSVPWEAVATVLVVSRWRDLPQQFWITYCINAFLAYNSLPLYRQFISNVLYHLGITS
jgi:hypothetical protein